MNYTRLLNIMSGQDQSPAAHLARLGLSILELPYRAAVATRNLTFDLGLRQPAKLPRTTISIGNLTTGGTGKTPMVIELARRLQANGIHPAILMRGYKATDYGSDEAAELKIELGSAIEIQPNPSRVQGAQSALQNQPEIDAFILDDGFQHRQVHRDLNIVLIDATQPFGYNHVLPRGLLRESKSALRRADAVIITRADRVSHHDLCELDRQIERLTGQPATAHAAYVWQNYRDGDNQNLPLDTLTEKSVATVCGIGNPAAFNHTAASHAATVTCQSVHDDHHHYTRDEIQNLITAAKDSGAHAIITTDKDWTKIKPLIEKSTPALPILRPHLAIQFTHGEQAIGKLIEDTLNQTDP